MPPPDTHRPLRRQHRVTGLSAQTVHNTDTAFRGLTPEQALREDRHIMASFALEGASLDILAELTLKYRQQEELLDKMVRQGSTEKLPASFHNTQRLLVNDCVATLSLIAQRRDKEGRDCSKRPEKKAKERKEQKRKVKQNQANTERERQLGYFVDTRYGVMQPGTNLLGLDLAIRDIIRMRMLPKSPYEDHIIARELDALTEEEKKIDPESLSRKENTTDLHDWYPGKYACPGPTKYQQQSRLVRRLFLERIQEYNKVWEQAEKHVDGLMAAKGIKPRSRYPYLGVPPLVRKVAQGDPQAIEEFERELNACDYTGVDNTDVQEWDPAYNPHPDPDHQYEYPVTREERQMGGRASTILIALFLAFSCAWTCLTLILGHSSHHTLCDAPTTSVLTLLTSPCQKAELEVVEVALVDRQITPYHEPAQIQASPTSAPTVHPGGMSAVSRWLSEATPPVSIIGITIASQRDASIYATYEPPPCSYSASFFQPPHPDHYLTG